MIEQLETLLQDARTAEEELKAQLKDTNVYSTLNELKLKEYKEGKAEIKRQLKELRKKQAKTKRYFFK